MLCKAELIKPSAIDSDSRVGQSIGPLWDFWAPISIVVELYTANVCRDLRGVYREIGVRGFQIYGDYM